MSIIYTLAYMQLQMLLMQKLQVGDRYLSVMAQNDDA